MSVVLNCLGIYLKNHSTKILMALLLGVAIQIIVLFLKGRGQRKINLTEFFLILDCSIIVMQTLFGRSRKMHVSYEIQPFYSYVEAVCTKDLEMAIQIMMNIVMFIPFGFLLPYRFRNLRKIQSVMILTFAMSLIIEVIQGIGKIGLFETDDIINNVLGATMGFLFYGIIKIINEKAHSIKQKEHH